MGQRYVWVKCTFVFNVVYDGGVTGCGGGGGGVIVVNHFFAKIPVLCCCRPEHDLEIRATANGVDGLIL